MDVYTDRMGYKQGKNISWCFSLAAPSHCCALLIPHNDSCAVVLRPSSQHTVVFWSTVTALVRQGAGCAEAQLEWNPKPPAFLPHAVKPVVSYLKDHFHCCVNQRVGV